jgi:hypothetical protein
MDDIAKKSFYGGGANFDLTDLIKYFSFTNLIERSKRNDKENEEMGTNLENGAVLVITDKQYVLTYNQGFGASAHNPAFARVYKEIHGGGIIEDFKEMHTLNGKCKKQFIFARIVFEKGKGGLYFENLSKTVVNHMNYQQLLNSMKNIMKR